MLGVGGVGKSCVSVRFTSQHFVEAYDPTIENTFNASTTDSAGRMVVLEIVDTSGSDTFSGMRDFYFRKCQGFCLVYSVNSLTSFNSIKEIHNQIVKVKEDQFVTCLVANKCDLDDDMWEVSTAMAKNTAEENSFDCFCEVSAKTGEGIKPMFLCLVDILVRKFLPKEKPKKESWCKML